MAQRKGFCDVYVAKVLKQDEKTYTTSTPVKLFKAVKGKVKLKYKNQAIYFDDLIDEMEHDFEGGEIEIEGDNLTPEMKEIIRGHRAIDGMTIISADDKASDVAIAFRSKNSDGTYQFYQYYRVNFGSEEEEDFEQITDKSKRQNVKLKGSIMKRSIDGFIGVDVNESYLTDKNIKAKEAIKSWFSKVQEPIVKENKTE